jgi:uncharacterized protein (TIGR01244 family)
MQTHQLSPDYSVAPQVSHADISVIVSLGFKSIICNRPDCENSEDLQIASIKAAALSAGLEFAENVFDGSNFGPDIITKQTELLERLPNPVLAYCTSGARSSVVWAFVNTGIIKVDKILNTLSKAGYQLDNLRPQLEQLALTRAMG